MATSVGDCHGGPANEHELVILLSSLYKLYYITSIFGIFKLAKSRNYQSGSVRNPLRGSAVEQHKEDCHVVISTVLMHIVRNQTMHEILQGFVPIIATDEVTIQFINKLLWIIAKFLPNSITGNNNVLILVFVSGQLLDLGHTNDHLLIIRDIWVRFVVEISQCSAYVDAAVYSVVMNSASSFENSIFLFLVGRFVIDWKWHCDSIRTQNRSSVSQISIVNGVWSQKEHIRSRTCSQFYRCIWWRTVGISSHLKQSLLTPRWIYHII